MEMIDRDDYNYDCDDYDEYYQQPPDDGLLEWLEAEEREAEEQFQLTAPDDYVNDDDSLGELSTNGSGIDIDVEEPPF
jgi:hypothetical protein